MKNMLKKIVGFENPNIDNFIIFMGLMLGFYLGWRIQDIIIFCIVIWLIVKQSSFKLVFQLAGMGYLTSVVLLIIKRRDIADDFSAYAFYFLIIGTIFLASNYLKATKLKN